MILKNETPTTVEKELFRNCAMYPILNKDGIIRYSRVKVPGYLSHTDRVHYPKELVVYDNTRDAANLQMDPECYVEFNVNSRKIYFNMTTVSPCEMFWLTERLKELEFI